MYLSLIELELKTSAVFKILTLLNQKLFNVNFGLLLLLALFWPSYLTFKSDFCFNNQ